MKHLFPLLYLFMGLSVVINIILLYSQSILLDEAQSIWVALKPVPTLLLINAQDVQTPLYALILHFLLQIFGSQIIIARYLSLLFFLATLPILYLLIHESSQNEEAALLGVALFSLSPFILWYSAEARTYSLLALLSCANNLYFLRLLKSRGRRGSSGYLFTAILGLYSHYFFLFLLASQALYGFVHILQSWRRPAAGAYTSLINRWHHLPAHHFYYQLFSSLGLAGLTLIPWLYYVYTQGLATNTQPLLPHPSSYNIIQLFINFLFGFPSLPFQSLLIALWPLIIMVFFFIFTQPKRSPLTSPSYFLSATFIPVMIVFLGSFIKPIFLDRYLIFVAPTLFALIAWLLVNYGRRLSSVLTISLLGSMLFFLGLQDSSQATPVKEDYQDVDRYLVSNVTPEDVVAVSAPFTIYPIEYAYTGSARLDTIPHWDRYHQGPIPPFTDIGLATQMDQYRQVYSRLFVVLSYDQGYQSTISNYLDHHLELLGHETYPANIDIRVYRLRYDIPAYKPLPQIPVTSPTFNLHPLTILTHVVTHPFTIFAPLPVTSRILD